MFEDRELFSCALNYTKDYQIISLCPKHLLLSLIANAMLVFSPTSDTCVLSPHGDPSEAQARTGDP